MTFPRDHAQQPHLETVTDAVYFFRRFLRNPRGVASLVPSSRFLTAAMFAGLPLSDGDVIVEFGPGTGAFTREVRRLRNAGMRLDYLGIERDAGMVRRLCTRFPELDFQLGDVCDAPAFIADRGLPPVKVVLSGLPLVWMPHDVLDEIFAGLRTFLHADGVFRTFSYMHNYPTSGAIDLRSRIREAFSSVQVSRPVMRNLPPALVLTGRSVRS
jgi:phosphatidylethanolamine/phosphatidyl-N-methylethanolamine N-methyltransferase